MRLNTDKFYEALQRKDRRFDGLFFTAVKTTRIYCRPICPAKVPLKKNITFYLSAIEAEQAGFRPCLRCRPETAPGSPVWVGTESTVRRAIRIIQEDRLNGMGIEGLAEKLGISSRHLNRLFNEHVGVGPKSFLMSHQIQLATTLINGTLLPIAEIAAIVGFENVRRFNAAFLQVYGFAPSDMRRNSMRQKIFGKLTLNIGVRPPFDWPRLLDYLKIRAIPGVEAVEDGYYRRTIAFDGDAGVLSISYDAKAFCLSVEFPVEFAKHTMRILERVRHMFDLRADVGAIKKLLKTEPVMKALLKPSTDLRVPGCWDGFELSVLTIVHQQISLKAGATIIGRIVERCGSSVETEFPALHHVFCEPKALAAADLERIGMPEKRVKSIKALASLVARQEISINPSASVNETVTFLKGLPGIGDWTVNYIAMRALRDTDCFLETDLGIKKAVEKLGLQEQTPARMKKYAENWVPWKSYATMALWSSLDA